MDPSGARPTSVLERAAESKEWALFDAFRKVNQLHHPYFLRRGLDRKDWKGQEIFTSDPSSSRITAQDISKCSEVDL